MTGKNRDKDLGKKNKNREGKITQNCNISDVADSVEFASEPFGAKEDKFKSDRRKDKC